ncbi:hypothetical protein N9C75_01670 [Alphaproteobacteria bacterium]|nr:hypothetical protein [Alphaproteobacteria bacterium]
MNKQHRFDTLKNEIWQNYFSANKAHKTVSLDVSDIDDCLDGGLAIGRVHLITGSGYSGAVRGFILAILRKIMQENPSSYVVWCTNLNSSDGILYGAGLAAIGIDPARLILVDESHPLRGVAAMEEALNSARQIGESAIQIAAVIGDYAQLANSPDLWHKTARRLQLAAEKGNVLTLMSGITARIIPAAGFESYWQVSTAVTDVSSPHVSSPHVSSQSATYFYNNASWDVNLSRTRSGRRWSGVLNWQFSTGRLSKRSAPEAQINSAIPARQIISHVA